VVTLNKLSDYSYQFDLRKKKLITMDFEDKFGMTWSIFTTYKTFKKIITPIITKVILIEKFEQYFNERKLPNKFHKKSRTLNLIG